MNTIASLTALNLFAADDDLLVQSSRIASAMAEKASGHSTPSATRFWPISEEPTVKNLCKVSMNEIRSLAAGHWFDRDAMKFFDTTLPAHGYRAADGAIYFYSGDQFHGLHTDGPRLYTVRRLDPKSRHVDTVGDFQAYKSARAANLAARLLAVLED